MGRKHKAGGLGMLVARKNPSAGLSVAQIENLKRGLRAKAPSEPWVEAQFGSVDDIGPHGQPMVRRFHDSHVFPPGGTKTAMIRCGACDVFTPPNAFENDLCLDHSDHVGWGISPSAAAIAALQYYNVRMEETELPPESTRALRQEIEAALARKRATCPESAQRCNV